MDTSNQNQGNNSPSWFTWIIIFLLFGALLNMCDGRSEAQKMEDSYKGVIGEYYEYKGWD